jgi:hypothetical protein
MSTFPIPKRALHPLQLVVLGQMILDVGWLGDRRRGPEPGSHTQAARSTCSRCSAGPTEAQPMVRTFVLAAVSVGTARTKIFMLMSTPEQAIPSQRPAPLRLHHRSPSGQNVQSVGGIDSSQYTWYALERAKATAASTRAAGNAWQRASYAAGIGWKVVPDAQPKAIMVFHPGQSKKQRRPEGHPGNGLGPNPQQVVLRPVQGSATLSRGCTAFRCFWLVMCASAELLMKREKEVSTP